MRGTPSDPGLHGVGPLVEIEPAAVLFGEARRDEVLLEERVQHHHEGHVEWDRLPAQRQALGDPQLEARGGTRIPRACECVDPPEQILDGSSKRTPVLSDHVSPPQKRAEISRLEVRSTYVTRTRATRRLSFFDSESVATRP